MNTSEKITTVKGEHMDYLKMAVKQHPFISSATVSASTSKPVPDRVVKPSFEPPTFKAIQEAFNGKVSICAEKVPLATTAEDSCGLNGIPAAIREVRREPPIVFSHEQPGLTPSSYSFFVRSHDPKNPARLPKALDLPIVLSEGTIGNIGSPNGLTAYVMTSGSKQVPIARSFYIVLKGGGDATFMIEKAGEEPKFLSRDMEVLPPTTFAATLPIGTCLRFSAADDEMSVYMLIDEEVLFYVRR